MNNKTEKIQNYLNELFPAPVCELNYKNNFELLVAVILSAQCTDKRVNIVTKELFKKYNTPKDFAFLEQEELEKLIYSCGFYKNKAKYIISASKDILERFNGQVPSTQQQLKSLSGVGQKTANVVYSVGFGGDAIAVDTHVFRVSHRLNLSTEKDPTKVEQDLCKIFKKKDWGKLHYQFVLFGRYKCKSQRPDCKDCKLKDICSYYKLKG